MRAFLPCEAPAVGCGAPVLQLLCESCAASGEAEGLRIDWPFRNKSTLVPLIFNCAPLLRLPKSRRYSNLAIAHQSLVHKPC